VNITDRNRGHTSHPRAAIMDYVLSALASDRVTPKVVVADALLAMPVETADL